MQQIDDEDRNRHRGDGNRRHGEHRGAVATVDGIDQQRAQAGIGVDLFGDDRAREDRAERQRKRRQLRHGGVAHHVGEDDASARHTGELGVGHIVLGDDVRDQRPHAQEPGPEPDDDERRDRQDRMLDDREDEVDVPPRLDVHRIGARDRQDRPHEAEEDQEEEGDDVVGDRLHAHRRHPEDLEQAVVLEVASQSAEQVAQRPGDQYRSAQKEHRPRERPHDQGHRRRGKGEQRRPEVALDEPTPEVHVLLGERLVDAVEIGERRTHLLDGFRAEVRSGRDAVEHAVDGVDRGEMA